MRRDLLAYLYDISLAISDIEFHTTDTSLPAYKANRTIRAAVEREFTIIGEAFSQMEKHFPGARQRVDEVRNIVAFRNFLIHAYGQIDDAEVLATVRGSMLELKAQVNEWIAELRSSEPYYPSQFGNCRRWCFMCAM